MIDCRVFFSSLTFSHIFVFLFYHYRYIKKNNKRNDIDNLQSSGLELLMETVQAQTFGRVRRFTLLGDGIFRYANANDNCIISYHFPAPAVPLEHWQVQENKVLKSIRQHIEHGYGDIENVFALCADRRNFKLKGNKSVALELINLTYFFYNCYCCDNGNSSSVRFSSVPPTLEEYLNNN